MTTSLPAKFLYGGDYNPDQWLDRPDVLEEDIRLMKLASVNCVSLGIFSWTLFEPREGVYEFEWFDQTVDRLHQAGIAINLATPSGAKPTWMGLKYPEIRRVSSNGLREPQGGRHNHCLTSPVYREKVRAINTKLSERYGKHPAVVLWHLSNEYNGECFCDLCFSAFREWLQKRYGTIDALNRAYWSAFWSHQFGDWQEITNIDESVNGLKIDWRRFVSDQCCSFVDNEIAAIRAGGSDRPVTTNMMGAYPGVDYWELAKRLDYVSLDIYPSWHGETGQATLACDAAFTYDLYRSMKAGLPWLSMESTPSQVNWADVSRLKKPGMLRLGGLQAVAHGSTSVMYFQWRKGRGAHEKFHGAAVDHVGHENTRVFRESAAVGAQLATLSPIADAPTPVDVAIIYDWNVRWGIDAMNGPRNVGKNYWDTCRDFYKPFWKRGIAVDVINSLQDFSRYRLIIAPMLYMLLPGVSDRLRAFVETGGTFVATYLTGWVNESDLCFTTGFPGPLRELLGVWVEETEALFDSQLQQIEPMEDNPLGLAGAYNARHYCDIAHCEGASVLARYAMDF
jgi:beta-galactosidase